MCGRSHSKNGETEVGCLSQAMNSSLVWEPIPALQPTAAPQKSGPWKPIHSSALK